MINVSNTTFDMDGVLVDFKYIKKKRGDSFMINLLKVLREQKEMRLKGNLYHITQIQFAYNTNHMEGSTLTEE